MSWKNTSQYDLADALFCGHDLLPELDAAHEIIKMTTQNTDSEKLYHYTKVSFNHI